MIVQPSRLGTVRVCSFILAIAVGVAGCGTIPGDGPLMIGAQATSTEALPFDVIELTPTTIVAVSQPPNIDRASITGSLPAGRSFVATRGDVLRVRVFERYEGGIFPTLQRSGADFGAQRVTDEGTINVPYAGVVQVEGLELSQIEHRIVAKLGTRAQDPQVIAEVVTDWSYTVMVSGEVKRPGRVSILDGVRTVVDAINNRGGLASGGGAEGAGGGGAGSAGGGSNQTEVVVRRGGLVILDAQYSELLAGGDIAIQKGDEIVARPNSRTFTVLGAVMKSGNIEMSKPNLSLLEALGSVGGLSEQRANKSGVYVFRMGDLETKPSAKARVFRLDLNLPVSIFVAQQFNIQVRDVVYVTNAPLYEYDKILKPIYQTFSTVSVVKALVP